MALKKGSTIFFYFYNSIITKYKIPKSLTVFECSLSANIDSNKYLHFNLKFNLINRSKSLVVYINRDIYSMTKTIPTICNIYANVGNFKNHMLNAPIW